MLVARATLFADQNKKKFSFLMLTLQINGEKKQFPHDINVAGLVAALPLTGKRFAIELNGEIVPRSCHETTKLSHGDKLEVVVAVGGG